MAPASRSDRVYPTGIIKAHIRVREGSDTTNMAPLRAAVLGTGLSARVFQIPFIVSDDGRDGDVRRD